MEVSRVRDPKECPEAGTHVPPGVEVKALQPRVSSNDGEQELRLNNYAECMTNMHLKRFAGVVVEQPARHTRDVSSDGEFDKEGRGGIGCTAAVETHAAEDEPDDHERVADVMGISVVAEWGVRIRSCA